MRRADRQVTDSQGLREILKRCKVCRIAMEDEKGLYIVPMNFGYDLQGSRLTLYFHCASRGRKLDAMAQNPRVAFEMDAMEGIIEASSACGYGCAYCSITGSGDVRFLAGEEKRRALSRLMACQAGREFSFTEEEARGVTVFSITSENFTGKRRELPADSPANGSRAAGGRQAPPGSAEG